MSQSLSNHLVPLYPHAIRLPRYPDLSTPILKNLSTTSLHPLRPISRVPQSLPHLTEKRLHRPDLSGILSRDHSRLSLPLELANILLLRTYLFLPHLRFHMDLYRVRLLTDFKLVRVWVRVRIVISILVVIPSTLTRSSRPVSRWLGEPRLA
jgi:hypothetical protein